MNLKDRQKSEPMEKVDQTAEMREVLSQNYELKNELQKKSEIIKSLNEQIGRLSESDNVLQENEQLRKLNQELQQSKCEIRKEAGDTILAYKKQYEKKVIGLSSRENNISWREEEIQNQELSIQRRNQKIDQEVEKVAQKKYASLKKVYYGQFVSLLFYGIMITLFEAIKSKAFKDSFFTFSTSLWNGFGEVIREIWDLGTYMASISQYISEPIISKITYGIIQIMISGGVLVGAGMSLYFGGKLIFPSIKRAWNDEITRAVLAIIVAFIVFFADWIHKVISLNLIVLYMLLIFVYVMIRHLVEMEDKEERKKLLVNLGGWILAIAVIWIVLTELSKCLRVLF